MNQIDWCPSSSMWSSGEANLIGNLPIKMEEKNFF